MPDWKTVKQSYFKTVGGKPYRFIGIQPKTFCKDDLQMLSDDWRYLLKFDGERRLVYISMGECYLIDRNHRFDHMPGWGRCLPPKTTLVLDGELLTVGGMDGRPNRKQMKIFDVMHLNGRNVENLVFTDRMSLLSEYWVQHSQKVWWGICSVPYKLSDLKKHLTTDGSKIVNFVEGGSSVDGIVLMDNKEYVRGAFPGCLKFKNAEMNTLDLEILSLSKSSNPSVDGSILGSYNAMLGMMCKLECVEFRTTRIFESELQKFKISVGSIVEFAYEHDSDRLVPLRDRSGKKHPNGQATVENIWSTYQDPVTAKDIVSIMCSKAIPSQMPVIAKVVIPGKSKKHTLLMEPPPAKGNKKQKASIPSVNAIVPVSDEAGFIERYSVTEDEFY